MLTETQQGSNSGTAVTHDSDPRKLEFQTIDYNDAEVLALGTSVDLTHALALGGSSGTPGTPGPVMSDLSGGTTSSDQIQLSAAVVPAVFSDLEIGLIDVEIVFSDAPSISATISALSLAELCYVQGTPTGHNLDVTSLFPDLATHYGKHITQFQCAVVMPFGDSPPVGGQNVTVLNCKAGLLHQYGTSYPGAFTDPIMHNAVNMDITPGGYYNARALVYECDSVPVDATFKLIFNFDSTHPQFNFSGWRSAEVNLDHTKFVGYSGQVDVTFTFLNEVSPGNNQVTFSLTSEDVHNLEPGNVLSIVNPISAEDYAAYFVSNIVTDVSYVVSQEFASRTWNTKMCYFQIEWPVTDGELNYTQAVKILTSATYGQMEKAVPSHSYNISQFVNPSFLLLARMNADSLVGCTNIGDTVSYQIDIATLQSLMTPEQLASQHVTVNVPLTARSLSGPLAYAVIIYDTINIAGFPDPTWSNISFTLHNVNTLGSGDWYMGTNMFSILPTTDILDLTGTPQDLDRASLDIALWLYPASVPPVPPGFNNILATKPYELRSRNVPAFRFNFYPVNPAAPPPQTDLEIQVVALVSQGKVEDETLWTKIPALSFGNSHALGATSDYTVLSFPARLGFLPLDMQGDIVKIPQGTSTVDGDFVGPWNYIRFLLLNFNGESTHGTQDYTGWKLEVIANAREL